jgi:hypothetical protein
MKNIRIGERNFKAIRIKFMYQILDTKSRKILERIEVIKKCVIAHRKNIVVLQQYANSNFNPKKNCYAPRLARYNRIPRSETRYLETLQNLSIQVMLLENEIQVLLKWGVMR